MSLAAIAQHDGLGPELANMTQRDLEKTGDRTPEKVKNLVDLAIATGRAALSNVVTVDNYKTSLIKLGMRGGQGGVEFDFKAYTPKGQPIEVDTIHYTPSAQKLAGISQKESEGAMEYSDGIGSSKMLNSMLKAWLTIAGFLSVMDRVLFEVRQIGDAINDKDYIVYKIPSLSDDSVPEQDDTALRGDVVDETIIKAQQEFKNLKLRPFSRDVKRELTNMIAELQKIRSLIKQHSVAAARRTSNGDPCYSADQAEKIYQEVVTSFVSFFDQVKKVIEANWVAKNELADKLNQESKRGKKFSEHPDLSEGSKSIHSVYSDMLADIREGKNGTWNFDKVVTQRGKSKLPFRINLAGLTNEQKYKKIKRAMDKYNRLQGLKETGRLAKKNGELVPGSYDKVKDLTTGQIIKFSMSTTDERGYNRHINDTQFAKRAANIDKYKTILSRYVPANESEANIINTMSKIVTEQTSTIYKAYNKEMKATNHKGRIDLNLVFSSLPPQEREIAIAAYKARQYEVYKVQFRDPRRDAAWNNLSPLAKQIGQMLGKDLTYLNFLPENKKRPSTQQPKPYFSNAEKQRQRKANRLRREKLRKMGNS